MLNKYALITTTNTVNTIYGDSTFVTAVIAPSYTYCININSTVAGPSWTYDPGGGTFTAPPVQQDPGPPPIYTSLSPTSGGTSGGTSLTITGSGFEQGATVTVGGTTAAIGSVSSDGTQIVCTTPAGSAGARDVVIINKDGGSITATGAFTYSSFTPGSVTYTYPTNVSGTYTVPAGCTTLQVELWGGGGGGGGGWEGSGTHAPSGGGGGGYCTKTFSVTSGDTFAWVVGLPGDPGAVDNPGGAGTASTQVGHSLSAGGGGGGLPDSSTGGAGGTSSGGTTNTTGTAGSAPVAATGGNGGAGANGGAGGAGGISGFDGSDGTIPGGGGGGAGKHNAGGTGASGQVKFSYS